MKTANEFMGAAAALRELREKMRPPAGDPYAELRNRVCCNLLIAASDCQRIAEALAAGELAESKGA